MMLHSSRLTLSAAERVGSVMMVVVVSCDPSINRKFNVDNKRVFFIFRKRLLNASIVILEV